MLHSIFGKVLELSLVGSYCILLVLPVRFLLLKCERRYACFLWLAVFLKLAVPFTVQGSFSLIPRQVIELSVMTEEEVEDELFINGAPLFSMGSNRPKDEEILSIGNNLDSQAGEYLTKQEIAAEKEAIKERNYRLGSIAQLVWLVGLLGILLFNLVHALMTKRQVAKNRWTHYEAGERIAEIEGLAAPFLWGFFRPVICLPAGLSEEERKFIIAHESCHRRRCDPIVKMAVFAVTAIHWFNPAVWAAWAFFCRDMEVSCDEAVLAGTKENIKKQYAQSLLKYAAAQNGYLVTPLTFGEPSVRTRIKNVLRFRRKNAILTGIAGAAAAAIAIGLAVQPRGVEEQQEISYYIVDIYSDPEGAGVYASPSGSKEESNLVLAGDITLLGEDESFLYVGRRVEDGYFIDSIRRADSYVESNITGQLIRAGRIPTFFADDTYIVYAAGEIQGSMAVFWGSFYSYNRKDGTLKEADVAGHTTGSERFHAADGFIYYQKYWEDQYRGMWRIDFAFEKEEQVGEELSDFLIWDEKNAVLFASKENGRSIVKVDPEEHKETQIFNTEILSWKLDREDKIYFRNVEWRGEDIFLRAEQWGYRGQYGWRDSMVRWAELLIRTDGSGSELLGMGPERETETEEQTSETEAESSVSSESAGPFHVVREGYKEAVITHIAEESIYYTPGRIAEEELDALAQRALKELYDLTGFQVEECVYECTDLGSFYFAREKEDLDRSRVFYSRSFGEREGYGELVIDSMYIAYADLVWYSDVQQLDLPADVYKISEENLAVWFLKHSAVYRGEEIVSAERQLDDIRLITADGSFYEVYEAGLDMRTIGSIYGPYPEGFSH